MPSSLDLRGPLEEPRDGRPGSIAIAGPRLGLGQPREIDGPGRQSRGPTRDRHPSPRSSRTPARTSPVSRSARPTRRLERRDLGQCLGLHPGPLDLFRRLHGLSPAPAQAGPASGPPPVVVPGPCRPLGLRPGRTDPAPLGHRQDADRRGQGPLRAPPALTNRPNDMAMRILRAIADTDAGTAPRLAASPAARPIAMRAVDRATRAGNAAQADSADEQRREEMRPRAPGPGGPAGPGVARGRVPAGS